MKTHKCLISHKGKVIKRSGSGRASTFPKTGYHLVGAPAGWRFEEHYRERRVIGILGKIRNDAKKMEIMAI